MEANLLTRTLGLGSYGKDVDGIKRTVYRALDRDDGGSRLKTHMSRPLLVRRMFGTYFAKDVAKLKRSMSWGRNPGKVEPGFYVEMKSAGYPDALADDLLEQYRDERKQPPPAPRYVEPLQGFSSLNRKLWEEYTLGRNMGLRDLGTYNRNSRLPSGLPSDHAVYPAVAFDLGFSPQIGYDHLTARKFFHLMVGSPDVHYVILGNKIWSTEKGLHGYYDGGHEGHVHVSGHR